MDAESDDVHSGWPVGSHMGRQAFADALVAGVNAATELRAREMILCDADFAGWPLGERRFVDKLHEWSRAGGRTWILALDYRPVRLGHPRFVDWRKLWAHTVEARQVSGLSVSECPCMLWTPKGMLERPADERGPLLGSSQADRVAAGRQRLQAIWDQATPAFPATTLGL